VWRIDPRTPRPPSASWLARQAIPTGSRSLFSFSVPLNFFFLDEDRRFTRVSRYRSISCLGVFVLRVEKWTTRELETYLLKILSLSPLFSPNHSFSFSLLVYEVQEALRRRVGKSTRGSDSPCFPPSEPRRAGLVFLFPCLCLSEKKNVFFLFFFELRFPSCLIDWTSKKVASVRVFRAATTS